METRSNHVLVGTVLLILLALLALFTIWLARVGGTHQKEFDIFYKQAVDGLAKGSPVTYAGVISGQVKDISVWKEDPAFVRVRVQVNDQTPILRGTTASILGSFTGTSNVSLAGGVRGEPEITCPPENPLKACPYGVPTIPTKPGGFGAILNAAPQLLERLSTLTERLTGLLTDKNQGSVQSILANTNQMTKAFADRAPEIAATVAETRVAIAQAGLAAKQIGDLAQTSNGVLSTGIKPTIANLNQTIASARTSTDALNAALGDARPGLQAFSKQTVPEVGQLVHDLRETAQSLSSIANKVDQQGAGSLIGSPKLPDYKGRGK